MLKYTFPLFSVGVALNAAGMIALASEIHSTAIYASVSGAMVMLGATAWANTIVWLRDRKPGSGA